MEISGRLHAGQDAALEPARLVLREMRVGRGGAGGDVRHGMWTPLAVEGRGVWTSAHPAGGRRGRAGIAQVAGKGKGGFVRYSHRLGDGRTAVTHDGLRVVVTNDLPAREAPVAKSDDGGGSPYGIAMHY